MDLKDVENLAKLTRIELPDEEKLGILSDMKSILEYVKAIEDSSIPRIQEELKLYNVWREDKIEPREFSRKLIVDQFPDEKDGFLKVKKIL